MASNTKLLDVSFAGSTVKVFGHEIKDFMDDANPVEFQDVEVSSVGVNFNGTMVRNAKPNVVMMSVTVIPASDDDDFLYGKWREYRVQGDYNDQWKTKIDGSVTLGGGRGTWNFKDGTMVSGPGGPSSNGEGKMTGRTYTFAFVTIV